jgi:hypothetical protein
VVTRQRAGRFRELIETEPADESQPRIDGLAFQREDSEDAFVHASEGLLLNETLEPSAVPAANLRLPVQEYD